jgi:amidohydrolase
MPYPAPIEFADLIALRRRLHQAPEVSRAEVATARLIAAELAALSPDLLLEGLGGHGVAAVFAGRASGPTLLLRAELDALPIHELSASPWRSKIAGVAHLCGHDGHMAILMGAAQHVAQARPARGRVVVLFQPAEEDGSGAAAVRADPRFAALAPDMALALHNMPGVPLGQAWLASGPVNCASMGLRITLRGTTAHAATPHTGRAPTPALARLLSALSSLATGGPLAPGWALATITHARLGTPAFGIAPGEAEIWVTLRALDDTTLATLHTRACTLAHAEAAHANLRIDFEVEDHFTACSNAPEATALLAQACADAGILTSRGDLPIRPSEDFGRFAQDCPTAMLFLGAGLDHPALHDETYDFPDALIAPGVTLFTAAIKRALSA